MGLRQMSVWQSGNLQILHVVYTCISEDGQFLFHNRWNKKDTHKPKITQTDGCALTFLS